MKKNHARATVGAATVEFAVVAPLMVMLTMGMMELGRVTMVKQMFVNASREGARLAVLPSAITENVISHVQTELANSGINGASVTMSPNHLASAPPGTPITVSISVNAASVSWIPQPLFVISKTIQASTTMRRESL